MIDDDDDEELLPDLPDWRGLDFAEMVSYSTGEATYEESESEEAGPLAGLRVEVSGYLKGCKTAAIQGNTLIVSPAMFDLLSHANEKELQQLAESIKAVRLPTMREMMQVPFGSLKPLATDEQELQAIRARMRYW